MRNRKERSIKHYKSSQKILLVGEGDFSFSACLARAFGSASNMVATSLLSEDMLLKTHRTCLPHLEELERRGCLVLYEVDVNDMSQYPTLQDKKFDVIVFNFPHAGHFYWLCERDSILIERHKRLLKAYFENAREMLEEGGEVHVAHRVDPPYNEWGAEEIATKAGLVLKQKVAFYQSDYPGYHNKRGSFIDGNKKFPLPLGDCFTFIFSRQEILISNTTDQISAVDEGVNDNHENRELIISVADDCHTVRVVSSSHSSDEIDKAGNVDSRRSVFNIVGKWLRCIFTSFMHRIGFWSRYWQMLENFKFSNF